MRDFTREEIVRLTQLLQQQNSRLGRIIAKLERYARGEPSADDLKLGEGVPHPDDTIGELPDYPRLSRSAPNIWNCCVIGCTELGMRPSYRCVTHQLELLLRQRNDETRAETDLRTWQDAFAEAHQLGASVEEQLPLRRRMREAHIVVEAQQAIERDRVAG